MRHMRIFPAKRALFHAHFGHKTIMCVPIPLAVSFANRVSQVGVLLPVQVFGQLVFLRDGIKRDKRHVYPGASHLWPGRGERI